LVARASQALKIHLRPQLLTLVRCPVHLQYIRQKYWEYEYHEVVTPNMYNLDLWHTSGHAAHYKVQTLFSWIWICNYEGTGQHAYLLHGLVL
jgi:hypothetical protein